MPTAKFIGASGGDAAKLAMVRKAVEEYHHALDRREHGDVACHKAMEAIENALGLKWVAPGSYR